MIETWRMGPIAAAAALGSLGFSWQEANRLVQMKRRCERGELDDHTDTQKRLLFARWLVQTGRLSEGESRAAPGHMEEALGPVRTGHLGEAHGCQERYATPMTDNDGLRGGHHDDRDIYDQTGGTNDIPTAAHSRT